MKTINAEDETISRAEVLNYINDVQYSSVNYDGTPTIEAYTACEWIFEHVKNLPSKGAGRPKGEWIDAPAKAYGGADKKGNVIILDRHIPVCSNCYKPHPHKSDFCEHCGADMRGAANEE